MAAFIGNIDARVDSKGRVFLPSSYRKLLPEDERERIVMRMDPDNAFLVLFPEGVWNKKVEDLQSTLDEWNAGDQMLLMQYVSAAEWLDIDSQGRVLIPKRYLQALGVISDVLFIGMLDRIVLWSREGYEKSRMSAVDFAKQLHQKMDKKNRIE